MASRTTPHASIEALESRIAPSVVIGAGGKVAHYTDLDGDRVTITVSKGRLSAADFVMSSEGATVPSGESLVMLDLSDDSGEFHRANITIVAKPGRLGGDGSADVGFINAGDGLTDLGRVFIDGDLGRIVAGDANDGPRSPGVRVLIAQDFGGSSDEVVGGIAKIVTGNVSTTGIVIDNVFSVGSTQTVSGGPSGVSIVTSIAGNGAGLVKMGSGTQLLGGSNTLTGGLVVSGNLGASGSGGTLQISSTNTFGGSASAETFNASNLIIRSAGNLTTTWPTRDVSSVSQWLTGLDTINSIDTNTVTGASTVNGSVLVRDNINYTSAASTSVLGVGVIRVNSSIPSPLFYSGVINSAVTSQTLAGLNAFTLGSPTSGAGTLTINNSNFTTLDLSKTGSGTLTLSNPLNFTGGLITHGGTMILNLNGGTVALSSGGLLNVITGGTIVPRFSAQTIPAGAKITTDAGTITFGEGNAVATFTAPDGSESSIGGAVLTINPGGSTGGQPNVASLELTGLDLGTAPAGSRKFEIEIGHNDAAIVQNRALYQGLLASGWIASAPVLGADGQITSIKLTKTSSLSFTAGN